MLHWQRSVEYICFNEAHWACMYSTYSMQSSIFSPSALRYVALITLTSSISPIHPTGRHLLLAGCCANQTISWGSRIGGVLAAR